MIHLRSQPASQAAVDHHPLALRLLVPEDPSTAAVGVEGPGAKSLSPGHPCLWGDQAINLGMIYIVNILLIMVNIWLIYG